MYFKATINNIVSTKFSNLKVLLNGWTLLAYSGSVVQCGEGESETPKPLFLNPMVHIGSSLPVILGGGMFKLV